MSGGRHYLFRHLGGIRNSSGKLAPGIDTRGEGGYAIWPPSTGYQVIHDVAPARWPVWLWWSLLEATEQPPRSVPSAYATSVEIADNRLRAFIDHAVRRLRDAPIGARHNTRIAAGRSCGGVAAQAGLSDAELEEMLIAARLPEAEEEKERRAIRWALAEGRKRPTVLPDREWSGRRSAA